MDGFIIENPIKMDDLGVPLFSETSISEKQLYCIYLICIINAVHFTIWYEYIQWFYSQQ